MPQYRRGRRLLRPQIDHLDDRCLLSGLTPAQVTAAYGLTGITFTNSSGTTKGDGSGETIALVEAYHDPTLVSDLQTFDQTYKLTAPTLTVVNQAGTQTNTGWSEEESLDVEWAHAIAPGAKIVVVEANSQSLQDMLAAVDTARNTPGVVAVSMSWGFNESSSEATYDSHFTTPSGHLGGSGMPGGITFVAASGDSGPMAGASYPAASPNVLSVGGTALILTSTGAYGSEAAWTDTGGGYSAFEPEPSYQTSIQTTGKRATPDVAFDADPQTGVSV
jgi:subtilase family serine protease